MRGRHAVALLMVLAIAVTAGCTAGGDAREVQSPGQLAGTPGEGERITAERAASMAENYIREYFAPPGETVKVTAVWEEHGVYGFNVSVMGMNYTSYITRDGALIFPTGMRTDMPPEMPPEPPEMLPEMQSPPPEESGAQNTG